VDLRVCRQSACRSFVRVRHGGTRTLRIDASPEPVIGPINGPAVGIGATIQLPMDILRVNATGSEISYQRPNNAYWPQCEGLRHGCSARVRE
jgi:enoyl-CoA hydratase/carnithine racemase